MQCIGKRKRSALSVLGRAGVEPHFGSVEVNLPPLKRQNLARNPPAGNVCEPDHASESLRKVTENGFNFVSLEESCADVVFAKKRDVRFGQQLASLNRQGIRSLQERAGCGLRLGARAGVGDVWNAADGRHDGAAGSSRSGRAREDALCSEGSASAGARLSTRDGGGHDAAGRWAGIPTSEVPRWEQDWRLHVLKREEAEERCVRIRQLSHRTLTC